jgi:hypothetical protein
LIRLAWLRVPTVFKEQMSTLSCKLDTTAQPPPPPTLANTLMLFTAPTCIHVLSRLGLPQVPHSVTHSRRRSGMVAVVYSAYPATVGNTSARIWSTANARRRGGVPHDGKSA